MAMVNQLPAGDFSAFSISRMQLPYVAMAALAGEKKNVRVGLQDNIYLSCDEIGLASNADLVYRAVKVLSNMNVKVLGPDDVREKLKRTTHSRY